MSDIRSIGIGMKTNTSGLTKGLDNAKKQLGGFSGAVSSMGGGISSGIGGIVTGFAKVGLAAQGAAVLAKGVWSAVSSPIKSAMEAEQVATSYEVMTGSAEKAKETISKLTKMGAETPFDFDNLSKSGSALLSFGRSADQVIDDLNLLTNVAAGDANKLSSLSLVFGQVAANGKLTGGDLIQMINQGFNPLNEIAARTGESMTTLRDRMSKGNISFDETRQAFVDATSAGGRFYQMNEKQSATFTGRLMAFQDAVQMRLVKLGTAMIDTFRMKEALAYFANFMDSTEGYVDSLISGLSSGFSEILPIIQQFGNVIVARFMSVIETVKWVWDSVSSLWQSSGAPSFQTMKDFIFDSLVVIEFGFTNFWSLLKLGATQGLLGIVSFSAGVQYQFTTVIPSYLSWFAENWQEIIGWMLDQTIERYKSFGSNLVSMFKNLPSLIAGTTDWSEVWKPFQATALSAVVDLPQIPDRVKGEFEKELAVSVADQSNTLTESLGNLLNKRRSELLGPDQKAELAQAVAPAAPAATTPTATPKSDKSSDKLLSASLFGSKEAQESILRHQMRGSGLPSADPVKIQQEQLMIAKREEARQKRMEKYMSKLAGETGVVTVNVS